MNKQFWLQKWNNNEIGFHKHEPNHLLVNYVNALNVPKNSRLFLPLCGKTLDIQWLLSHGYRVVGAELSQLAIEQLFESLQLIPQIKTINQLQHYAAENVDIFVGDVFELSADILGVVDAIYDRAALVALPETMRQRYTHHIIQITQAAPQLVITFDYDQQQMSGPPFAITPEEIQQHYQERYEITCLNQSILPDGVLSASNIREEVWLLN